MDCPTVLEKLREKIIEIKEVNEKAIILEGKLPLWKKRVFSF